MKTHTRYFGVVRFVCLLAFGSTLLFAQSPIDVSNLRISGGSAGTVSDRAYLVQRAK